MFIKNSKVKAKGLLSAFLSLVMILSSVAVFPLTALAVDDPGTLDSSSIAFWADPENTLTADDIEAFNNGDKTSMVGAVAVHKRSGSSSNYYLFLPSNADCTNLKVWFTAETASVDGTPVVSGEPTDVFSPADEGGLKFDCTLTLGSTNYGLHIMKSGDVGAVYIDTESGTIANINNSSDKSVSESGTIMVTRPDGTVDYDGVLKKMKGRGNATWSAKSTKNPYNINLDKKAGLLGMAKSKKWCLLANSGDSTLLKNQITYDFAEYIGIKYQVVCKPVDLYVNQQYLGSYMLAEKVEIGSERINISDINDDAEAANPEIDPETGKDVTDLEDTPVTPYVDGNGTEATGDALRTSFPNANYYAHRVGARRYSPSLVSPADVTGGYLYELEISNRWVNETAGFCAYNRQGWVLKNCDAASKEMVDYSYNLLYALGSSVYNDGVVPSTETTTNCSSLLGNLTIGAISITNPAPAAEYQGKKWSDLLDGESTAKLYWTQEIFKNLDTSTSSTYFYKDKDSKDSKLYAGPMWDMDKSFGTGGTDSSRWGESLTSTSGWYAKNTRIYRWRANDAATNYSRDNQAPRTFYGALCNNCPDFWQLAQSRWYSLVEPATQILLGNATDSTGTLKSISEYVDTIAKSGSMNNYRHNIDNDQAYDASGINATLTNWLSGRVEWISNQISKTDISTDTNFKIEAIAPQDYTGSAVCPKLNVTYNGATLTEGTDYIVEYTNNIAPTKTAHATVTGLGLYTGEKTVDFTILLGTLEGGSVEIASEAFPDDVLTATVKNENGEEITDSVVYQWYADDAPILGETGKTYTVTSDDVGKNITVKAKGDGISINLYEITSNACAVTSLVVTDVLASWDYNYTVAPDALVNADETGETYYYTATGGKQKDAAALTASFDAANSAELKWSGSDVYVNGELSDQAPVLEADKTTPVPWGEYPYFVTKLSTVGYNNIKFTAKLGGSKKGARDYKLQYSTDGTSYTDITNATYSVSTNKVLENAFTKVVLPEACSNKKNVYIRIVASDDVTIGGGAYVGTTSGAIAVNNISITGEEVPVQTYTVEFVNHAGTTVSSEEYPEGTPAADVAVPSVTASWYDDDFHYSYAWGDIADVTANATYNETENKAAHSYVETVISAPDCTNKGENEYNCDCGSSYKTYPDELGHVEETIPATPPTCTEDGLTAGVKCSRCQAILTAQEVDPKLGHAYDSVVTPPTCTEQGYTTFTCTRGDDSYIGEYVDATGHTAGAAVKENETTTSYDSVIYCTVCQAELSRTKVNKPNPVKPSGSTPSEAEANNAKEDSSIIVVSDSRITTAVSIPKKTLTVNFSTVPGATNYRFRYRKAGAANWTYAWTGGKGSYTVRNLAKNGLYEFQIAVYSYKNGAWYRSRYSNVNYRLMAKLSKVKAKAGKKKATVTWKADKKASGYDIAYSTTKNGARVMKSVKGGKKKKYTIKKLKKGQKYYVMVRSYKMKNGKKYTGQWTTKTVKIK